MIWILRMSPETLAVIDNWYDAFKNIMVRADDTTEARQLASECAADEGPDVWLDDSKSSCEKVHYDGDKGILISDRSGVYDPEDKYIRH